MEGGKPLQWNDQASFGHRNLRGAQKKGVKTKRTAKDVMNKIAAVEMGFRKAADWLNGTGAGITNEASIKQYVTKLCPYFYELEAVMSSRPSTRRLVTEDDLGLENEEEKTDDDPAQGSSSEVGSQQVSEEAMDVPQTNSNIPIASPSPLSFCSLPPNDRLLSVAKPAKCDVTSEFSSFLTQKAIEIERQNTLQEEELAFRIKQKTTQDALQEQNIRESIAMEKKPTFDHRASVY